MTKPFLVLGSTGLVGREVADLLVREGREVRCATRTPLGGGDVFLDLLDPGSFAQALHGVGAVLLVSRPADEDAHVHAEAFVDAMRRARVGRVVVLSAMGAALRPESSLRQVEAVVEQSGIRWTHVRPNFFMQDLARPTAATEIASHGTLSLPFADARIAYVDARDVAAVLHRVLVDESFAGETITVSGPQALDHRAIASSIADALGSPVSYVPVDEGRARGELLARGLSPGLVERVLGFYALVREGCCGAPDQRVAALLGRPLRTWREYVAEVQPTWRPISRSH
jgi:uncharacterized protein YbjT (DUF2867 family)